MTRLLERLLGRLPIGWLQLIHSPARFTAALIGVAFANILVLMQLGFLGALTGSIRFPYDAMAGTILISGSDMNTLADGSPLPRQRMFQALAVDGVARAVPLYSSRLDWKQPDGSLRTMEVYGVDPGVQTFRSSVISPEQREGLVNADRVLLDAKTRNLPKGVAEQVAGGERYSFEARGHTLSVIGLFTIGGGFAADGYMVTSDQTFLRLFPERSAGAPNQIIVTVAPGFAAADVITRLKEILPEYDTKVRSIDEAAQRDQTFQTTQRPVGLILGFGMVIGVLVGIVIVYQVLSTDVADHLKEYATFKAIGYPQRFFLSIVFEEALVLALLGFMPGFTLSLGLYALVGAKTGLPLAMTVSRAALVFFGTLLLCSFSGALATRKLARANPADLF
ncbi:MAG: ABC transporter permease DevC [Proteobacteria bacterium]|nr:ABC transporter permease DevC [Pseudomonadota bacterium]